MKTYHTRQKAAVLSFLEAHAQQQYSIQELHEALGDVSGKSTLYRLIQQLVDEGSVRRFARGASRTFFYQYLGCRDCGGHLHLKCTGCGALVHLEASVSEQVAALMEDREFELDEQTMLYGRCRNCQHRKAASEQGGSAE